MEHTPITAGGSSTEQDEACGAQTCAVSHCAEPLVRYSRGGVLPLSVASTCNFLSSGHALTLSVVYPIDSEGVK